MLARIGSSAQRASPESLSNPPFCKHQFVKVKATPSCMYCLRPSILRWMGVLGDDLRADMQARRSVSVSASAQAAHHPAEPRRRVVVTGTGVVSSLGHEVCKLAQSGF